LIGRERPYVFSQDIGPGATGLAPKGVERPHLLRRYADLDSF
jgi:hypothetical protein